jgi:PqqD family protein of HPr-rel-A system
MPLSAHNKVLLRRPDLTAKELDGEGLVYDLRSGRVHHLNAAALLVWKACDDLQYADELITLTGERFNVSPGHARAWMEEALEQLQRAGLLEKPRARGAGEVREGQPTDMERVKQVPPDVATAEAGLDRADLPRCPTAPSRRDFLDAGFARFLVAAPLVSSFIASGAYASGPSFSAAFGTGGCKNVGYSCAVENDCCDGGTRTSCQDQAGPTNTCCVLNGQTGCTADADCCDVLDVCNAGTCE